jgi:hypothetical protein
MRQGLCNGNSSVNTAVNNDIFEIQQTVFNFNTKQNNRTQYIFSSDGYVSIWLIPKIG